MTDFKDKKIEELKEQFYNKFVDEHEECLSGDPKDCMDFLYNFLLQAMTEAYQEGFAYKGQGNRKFYQQGYKEAQEEIREKIRQEALRAAKDFSKSSIPMNAKYQQGYDSGYQNGLIKSMEIIDSSLSLPKGIESQDGICTEHGRKGCFHRMSEKKDCPCCCHYPKGQSHKDRFHKAHCEHCSQKGAK